MADDAAGQVTQLLNAAEPGEGVSDELFPLVYDELRQLAHRQMLGRQAGQTLQTTALVHEAYLRLVGKNDRTYKNRSHFVAAAARAMRHILVDQARQLGSLRRGGKQQRVAFHDVELEFYGTMPTDELIALDNALTDLQQRDPLKAKIVTLRYFGGMTIEETASAVGKSAASVKHHWKFAKAWLYREMKKS